MPGEDFIAHTQCSVLDWDPATVELLTPSITPCCWRPTSGNDLTLSDETAYTLIAARPGWDFRFWHAVSRRLRSIQPGDFSI